MELPIDQLDDLFAEHAASGVTPGLVYGVIRDGELVHDGAFGSCRLGEDARPDAGSVFRIASMSKSFTAAAILLLRDRGLVDLDEAVAQYVPELVDQPPYAPDSPAVTLRMLLTMSAGLPTDDPWGDRQESLGYEEFGTFLDGGFTVGHEAGTGYEYSNLGFALLGRVVENVTGGDDPAGAHRDFVEHELLAPLGMTSSHYDATQVGDLLVPGHVTRSSGVEELPATPPGAFSAMGGLHSSVADLTRWIAGFLTAFDQRADAHPLAKASRREMQQLHQLGAVNATLAVAGPESGIGAVASGYGFGLMIDHDARLGRFVHHSGGYPGYGSRMIWHPATRTGVVTLSNGTYAGAYLPAMKAARLLARSVSSAPSGPPGAGRPLADRVRAGLAAGVRRPREFDTEGEEVFADPALFADNVELDVPDAERRVRLREARASVGLPLPVEGELRYWSRAMAHAYAVVPAERGRYDVEILLSPEAEPRLQQLLVTAVPYASAETLARAREFLAGADPALGVLRACGGEPKLIESPVRNDGTITEFLIDADPLWWKLTVTDSGETLEAHPTPLYPRLAHLAGEIA